MKLLSLLLIGAGLLTPKSTLAQNHQYFPLVLDSVWEYSITEGTSTVGITGTATINGLETYVRLSILTGPHAQTVINYWSLNEEGDVFLHGASNADGFSVTYDPPILWLDPPLSVGQSWIVETMADNQFLSFTTGIIWEGEVTVPAGLFHTYGRAILGGQVLLFADRYGSHDLLGFRVDPQRQRDDVSEWYNNGTGMIKDQYANHQLVDYMIPVGVEVSSWSELKALYR